MNNIAFLSVLAIVSLSHWEAGAADGVLSRAVSAVYKMDVPDGPESLPRVVAADGDLYLAGLEGAEPGKNGIWLLRVTAAGKRLWIKTIHPRRENAAVLGLFSEKSGGVWLITRDGEAGVITYINANGDVQSQVSVAELAGARSCFLAGEEIIVFGSQPDGAAFVTRVTIKGKKLWRKNYEQKEGTPLLWGMPRKDESLVFLGASDAFEELQREPRLWILELNEKGEHLREEVIKGGMRFSNPVEMFGFAGNDIIVSFFRKEAIAFNPNPILRGPRFPSRLARLDKDFKLLWEKSGPITTIPGTATLSGRTEIICAFHNENGATVTGADYQGNVIWEARSRVEDLSLPIAVVECGDNLVGVFADVSPTKRGVLLLVIPTAVK